MDKLLRSFNLSDEQIGQALDLHNNLLNEKDLKLKEIETSLNLKNEEVKALNKNLEELKKVDITEIQEKLSNLQEESKKRQNSTMWK